MNRLRGQMTKIYCLLRFKRKHFGIVDNSEVVIIYLHLWFHYIYLDKAIFFKKYTYLKEKYFAYFVSYIYYSIEK